VIGHEAQLMERFDVSRSVLREAIRTLESSGVVTVRTGRGGGLVVTEPRAEAVALAASLYLDYTGFGPAQLFRTWLVVQGALMDLAVETATDDELLELRECQRTDARLGVEGIEQSSFIERLAGLAENPILALFFLITRDLAMVHGLEMTPSAAAWFARQYGEMADALVERDAEQARAILERFLRRLEDTGSVVVRRRRRQ
jgi:DNA-binding FadR family transcriptional regulator